MKRVPVNEIVHCGCVEGMKGLPDSCIPLTVTSPPYDGMREYGGHDFDPKPVIEQLWRITAEGGCVVWVVQDQAKSGSLSGSSARHQLLFREAGFRIFDTIILARRGRRNPAVHRYGPPEYAFVFSKGKPRTVNLLRDRPNKTAGKAMKPSFRTIDGRLVKEHSNRVTQALGIRFCVWEYSAGGTASTKDKIAYGHPAIMPEAVAKDFILSFSAPGDLVFDPMAGSGTTCKMALLNARRYLGFEIFEEYVQIANQRLKLFTDGTSAA